MPEPDAPVTRDAVGATRAEAEGLLRAAAAGRPAVVGPHLVVVAGGAPGARIPLSGGDLTVGRGRAADLRLADPLASRLHARIRVSTGRITVEDTGSKNGVRVNGAAIGTAPRPVRAGDEIALGGTVLAVDVAPLPLSGDPEPAPRPPAAARPRPLVAALLAGAGLALALAALAG
jgi:S-DNA-T family DNA segregation ATPase FtsK/SpoIIIE